MFRISYKTQAKELDMNNDGELLKSCVKELNIKIGDYFGRKK